MSPARRKPPVRRPAKRRPKARRPTNVTPAATEAGSAVTRFEVPGTIPPSQGGVVSFQVKIR